MAGLSSSPSGEMVGLPSSPSGEMVGDDAGAAELAAFLSRYPPFDALDKYSLSTIAEAAEVQPVVSGAVIVDAFSQPTTEVFVVLAGRVDLWNHAEHRGDAADERLEPGEIFGFSAMLTERPVGPLAIAVGDGTIARLPGTVVLPAFASPRGARFLAGEVSSAIVRVGGDPRYGVVDELIVRPPLVVEPGLSAVEVARAMTERGVGYAAVRLADGRLGLVTDATLRTHILLEGRPPTTPAAEIADPAPPVVTLGDAAAEALIVMLDRDAEFLLVTDRTGEVRGVITPLDFASSASTAGVALHEQLRRATCAEDLVAGAAQLPATLSDLLARGLASSRVITVYAAMRDTLVRRAIALVFADHPDLSVDAFTWLSLGSNGRREAVLSSDMDSAAAFVDGTSSESAIAFRAAFADVNDLLGRAGLRSDTHGASSQRPPFARTNAEWRAAGQAWLAAPAENQGAMMTSLLVDGRPVHGDPGLPAVSRVFSELRRHPGTMRLLLQESLAKRAKLRSVRDILARRTASFDIKTNALLPITNIARWAALSVGSAALPTTERLRAAAGSAMLPSHQADTLVEVFDVLQGLRLEAQLEQAHAGEAPSDVVQMTRLSPLDRSVIAQAVREIAAVQRRMDNISVYVSPEAWTSPDPL